MGSDDALGLGEGTHLLRRRQRAWVDDFEAEWRQRRPRPPPRSRRVGCASCGRGPTYRRRWGGRGRGGRKRARSHGTIQEGVRSSSSGKDDTTSSSARTWGYFSSPDSGRPSARDGRTGAPEPGGAVHEIRVGFRPARRNSSSRGRTSVGSGSSCRSPASRGHPPSPGHPPARATTAQEDRMLRRRRHAVVRREVEQEGVVPRHHRPVRRSTRPGGRWRRRWAQCVRADVPLIS